MFSHAVLLAVASAAVASAEIFPGHQNFKRDIEARQTDGGLPRCIQPLLSLYSTLPTPPPQLVNVPPPADPCHVTVPPSIAPAYSSYSGELVSWVGEHSSEIFSALSACPQVTNIAGGQISSIQGSFCTASEDHSSHSMSMSGSASAESSAEETGCISRSGGSNAAFSSGPAQTSSTSSALATRETGFVGAAIAAVGFLGAVAVL